MNESDEGPLSGIRSGFGQTYVPLSMDILTTQDVRQTAARFLFGSALIEASPSVIRWIESGRPPPIAGRVVVALANLLALQKLAAEIATRKTCIEVIEAEAKRNKGRVRAATLVEAIKASGRMEFP